VLDGLRARRVPVSGFEALGLGEADPIADNETEAGREANRRIAFSLIADPAAAVETPVAADGATGSTYTGTAPEAPESLRLPAPARPDGLGGN
jgi:OmpA-OmpF porin, OOP family